MSEKKVGKRLLTWVLVLVMTLSLLPLNVLAAETSAGEKSSGIEFSKEVSGPDKETGDYTITMEAWATGTTTPTESVKPMDIVLVLDVSGSMDEGFTETTYTEYNSATTNSEFWDVKDNLYFQTTDSSYQKVTLERDATDFTYTAVTPTYNDIWYGEYYVKSNEAADAKRVTIKWYDRGFNSGYYLTIDDQIAGDPIRRWEWNDKAVAAGYTFYEKTASSYTYTYTYTDDNGDRQSTTVGNDQTIGWTLYARSEVSSTKMSALQSAVNSFIESVGNSSKDHRIAIVKFASDNSNKVGNDFTSWYGYNCSQIVMELTATDKNGVTQLENVVNGLRPAGATRSDYGMKHAKDIINASKAADTDDQRGRVVIMFTDGNPTDHRNFNVTVANGAISAAKDIKDVGAKVYTIGVFGTDPGDRINKYMHRVSSNYPNATSMDSDSGDFNEAAGYYSTAASATELNGIFSSISGEISEATNKALDSTTEVNDVVSDYFDLATGDVNSIKVYTADRTTNGGWADKQLVTDSSVPVGLSGKTIKVSGYDYAANYVTDKAKNNGTYGQKLIIEITVKPNDTGYNDSRIPTNHGDATVTLDNTTIASQEPPTVGGNSVKYAIDNDAAWPNNGAPEELYYPKDVTITVTDKVPTREGYTFTGWKVTEPETGAPKIITDETTGAKTFTMPAANVTLTAQWEEKNDAGYTVHYYKQGTTDSVASDKVVNNAEFGKEYTENAVSVTGYTPVDPTSQNVTADYSKKEITFYYTVNNDAGYTVHYYKQGTTDKVKDDKVVNDAEYNKSYTENAASVTGYTPVDPTSQNVTADYSKKEITFYYTVNNDAGYTVHYYKQGTTDSVASDKVVNNAEFGKEYTENAVSVTGYTAVDPTSQNVTADYNKKEITFYYGKADPTPGTFDFNDVDHSDDKATPAITKTVKGNVGRNFKETFAVTVKGTDEKSKATMSAASYTGKAEVTYSDLKDIAFQFAATDKLTFHNEGNYIYTVREIPGTTSRMSYDTTEYTLKINVVLDADSNTYKVESWQFTAGNREYPAALNIVNTYRTNHPSTPSKPTVEIPDDDALGLNTTDHFAYIVGYGNGEVRPQNNITRAEVATIFFRLLTDDVRDENLTKTNRYSDVAATSWYNTAVSTLSSMGIITGYPDGTFRPNAAITRAEFAAIAARFDNDGDKTAAKFSDIATHWAKDEISIAYNNGWITGYPDGTFGPQRDITRAETMTLVNRVLNRQPETEDDLLPNMTVWTDNANPKAWYYLAVQEATNSHYYKFKTNSKYEKWTELRETRDWTLLEK